MRSFSYLTLCVVVGLASTATAQDDPFTDAVFVSEIEFSEVLPAPAPPAPPATTGDPQFLNRAVLGFLQDDLEIPDQTAVPDPTDGDDTSGDVGDGEDDDEDDEDDLKAEIEKLLERLEELEDFREALEDAEEAAEKKKASKPTFNINGRIHADYWGFPSETAGIGFFENPNPGPAFGNDPDNFFAFRRVRLEMKGDILQTMNWRIQVDFNNFGRPEAKDVWLGFKHLPGGQALVIGNQKRPIGLDHLNSSRYNVFLERPFAVETFNEDARRPGITMYGVADDESLGWAYGVYLLENITTDGRYRGDNAQASGNARIFGTPWYDKSSGGRGYWHWGLSGMIASPDGDQPIAAPGAPYANEGRFRTRPEARSATRWLNTGRIPFAEWYETVGVESMLNIGSIQITGEYFHNWVQRASNAPAPLGDLEFHGGYLFLAWHPTGEHIPYNRATGTIGRLVPHENFWLVDRLSGGHSMGWGALQVAARYSYVDLTDGDITGGIGHSGTLALNWFFTPFSKVQFNFIYGNIDSRGPIGGFSSGEYVILGTRFAIEF